MGAQALSEGNYARAVKLLNKSLQLYPLPGVEALKSSAEKKLNESSSTATNGGTSATAPARSAPARSSSVGSDGRSFTEAQVEIVKRVLLAKEGGRGAHYRVLGVESNATENDLKRAYRRLALKLHPDKNSAPHADEAFKAVGLAYATLSDGQKRTIYDRYGEEDPDNRGGSARGGGGGGVHFRGGQEMSPEDIFNMMFGGMGGMGGVRTGPGGFHVYSTGRGFGGGGGQQFRRQRAQPRQREEEQSGLLLAQYLPLLVILLFTFFSYGNDDSRVFSLTRAPPFVNEMKTRLSKVKEIPYFVTDDFVRQFRRDPTKLGKVEVMVEKTYERYLESECRNQRLYKMKLERYANERAGLTRDERERQLQKAREYELSRCTELGYFFPKTAKKYSR